MKRLLYVLVVILAASAGLAAQEMGFPDGVAVGDVTHDAAVVWTRSAGADDVRVEYATDPSFVGVKTTGLIRTGPETDFAAKIDLHDLLPAQRYHVRPVTGRTPGLSATFVTPPPPDSDAPLTLIWGADT